MTSISSFITDYNNYLSHIYVLLNNIFTLFNFILLCFITYIIVIFMLIPYNIMFYSKRHYYMNNE